MVGKNIVSLETEVCNICKMLEILGQFAVFFFDVIHNLKYEIMHSACPLLFVVCTFTRILLDCHHTSVAGPET